MTKRFLYADPAPVSMELVALNDLIKEIVAGKQSEFLESDRILFVIDHNLGNLDQYNKREIPLIPGDDDSFLPDRMKLIYASVDIEDILEKDSKESYFIQACDLISYLVHLYYKTHEMKQSLPNRVGLVIDEAFVQSAMATMKQNGLLNLKANSSNPYGLVVYPK